MIWFCSSGVPFGGIFTSTCTRPSASYLRTPAAAIFQNSLALFVTNASLTTGDAPVPPPDEHAVAAAATNMETKSRDSARCLNHVLFIDCLSGLLTARSHARSGSYYGAASAATRGRSVRAVALRREHDSAAQTLNET